LKAIERVCREFEALKAADKERYRRLFCEFMVAVSRYGVSFAVGALLWKSGATASALLRHIGYLAGVPAAKLVDSPNRELFLQVPTLLSDVYHRLCAAEEKPDEQEQGGEEEQER